MNERQIQLFLYIYNKGDWITSEELADYFSLSKKTIQQEIKYISETLSQGLIIQTNNRKGYRIDNISAETKSKLNEEVYLSEGKNSLTYIGSKIIIMLLFYKDYVTMQELADSLYMSKTAISLEIDNIKRWIKRYKKLKLEVNGQKGIKIHGDELQKRIYCSIHITLDIFNDILFLESLKAEYIIYYNVIEKILINGYIDSDYIITGEDFKKNVKFITLSIIRSKLGYIRYSDEAEKYKIYRSSIHIIDKIEENLDYKFSKTELMDIALFLSQSNKITPPERSEPQKETRSKIIQFLKDINNLIDIDIDFQTVNIDLLEGYIDQKVIRENFGNIVINHYNEEILIEHPLETYLVQRLIPKYFPLEYVKELTYFSLFLTSIIDYNKKHSLLLVCDQSVSIISYLKNYLLNHFSYAINDIKIIPTYQYHEIKKENTSYDILLTTNQKVLLNEVNFFLISPILNKKDKENLDNYIKNKLNELKKDTREYYLQEYYFTDYIKKSDEKHLKISNSLNQSRIEEEVIQTFSKTNLIRYSISTSEKSRITLLELEEPILFEYKKINKIIDVNFNTEEDLNILSFFDVVSDILSTYK